MAKYGRHYLRKPKESWHKRRAPKSAAKRVVKSAKYQKSAKAQARQIQSLGRSLVRVRDRLREDATAISRWQIRVSSVPLTNTAGLGVANNKNIFVFPLTSLTSTGDNAAMSSFDPAPSTKYPTWNQVQPAIGTSGTAISPQTSPAFIRLYNQTVRMAFYQNNMNRSCRFDMFVVRLARDDETQSKHNTQQVQNNIDGVAFAGCPSTSTRFNPGEDFYCTSGWVDPNLGLTPGQPQTQGYELVQMNSQRYKVVHKRSFTLGRTVNNVGGNAVDGLPVNNAASITPKARDHYECSFSINYGGRKVMPYDTDGVDANAANITINDIKYSELDRDIKHWIVIFPSRDVSDAAGSMGCPVMSLISNITCRVPV